MISFPLSIGAPPSSSHSQLLQHFCTVIAQSSSHFIHTPYIEVAGSATGDGEAGRRKVGGVGRKVGIFKKSSS